MAKFTTEWSLAGVGPEKRVAPNAGAMAAPCALSGPEHDTDFA
jgi:hypothetical protein